MEAKGPKEVKSQKMLNKIGKLESNPTFKITVNVIISGSFKTAGVAGHVIKLVNQMDSSAQASYRSLSQCCQNLLRHVNSFKQTLSRQQRQSNTGVLYRNQQVVSNLSMLSEAMGYLGDTDWHRYLTLSQNDAQLHRDLTLLKKLVIGWLRVIKVLSDRLHN